MAWRIERWFELYDCAEARKVAGPLPWVRFPTSWNGRDFRDLGKTPEGVEAFAAFVLMVEAAAAQPRQHRDGILAKNGKPYTAAHLGDMTGWPPDLFARAFPILAAAGWITDTERMAPEDYPDATRTVPGQRPDTGRTAPGQAPDGTRTRSGRRPDSVISDTRGEERRGEERRREEKRAETVENPRQPPARPISTKEANPQTIREAAAALDIERPRRADRNAERRRKADVERYMAMATAMKQFAEWVTRRNWPPPDEEIILDALDASNGAPWENVQSYLEKTALARRPRGSDTPVEMRKYSLIVHILAEAFNPGAVEGAPL